MLPRRPLNRTVTIHHHPTASFSVQRSNACRFELLAEECQVDLYTYTGEGFGTSATRLTRCEGVKTGCRNQRHTHVMPQSTIHYMLDGGSWGATVQENGASTYYLTPNFSFLLPAAAVYYGFVRCYRFSLRFLFRLSRRKGHFIGRTSSTGVDEASVERTQLPILRHFLTVLRRTTVCQTPPVIYTSFNTLVLFSVEPDGLGLAVETEQNNTVSKRHLSHAHEHLGAHKCHRLSSEGIQSSYTGRLRKTNNKLVHKSLPS